MLTYESTVRGSAVFLSVYYIVCGIFALHTPTVEEVINKGKVYMDRVWSYNHANLKQMPFIVTPYVIVQIL